MSSQAIAAPLNPPSIPSRGRDDYSVQRMLAFGRSALGSGVTQPNVDGHRRDVDMRRLYVYRVKH